MKRKWKITIVAATLLVLAGGVYGGIQYSRRGIVTVQTGKTARQDLASIVTASGEIKPRNYINIGSHVIGRITDLLVKEGDPVRRGQLVARLESIQAQADVAAQRAGVSTAEAESAASEASVRAAEESIQTAQAAVERARADVQRIKSVFDRVQKLQDEKLIARQEYDQRKAELDAVQAGLREAESRLLQAKAQRQQITAQLSASQRRVVQLKATLRRADDMLDKYSVESPIDGVVTNLPVRVGETVVMGIQNSPGSTIMTIADMSLITAEVKVDETDIVNVRLGQIAEINIDAIPNRTFRGHVIEIGNTAILRSTGLAASQSAISSQEAKDFKVVVALDAPPEEIRPGLSCTAKVTTATRRNVLSIPIQALTVRQKGDLESGQNKPNGPLTPALEKARKEEIQGVFVIEGDRAKFRKVETGITGATDIEVLSGLKAGDEIVTGSYKVIRTLRTDSRIKIDNKTPKPKES
ncbi:MAG: HlyD family secretion protein [Acidobacteria bacterium]|nr:HlyD family secretion protein [Acidobacteriota bacterium]MBI3278587.1 HlyD family secretion protein [Acidobacteriota bacterium]